MSGVIALPYPVEVVRLVTRCHVIALVPDVAWQMFIRISPTLMPAQKLPGLPAPAPTKKGVEVLSTTLWIWVDSYINICLASVKPNVKAARTGLALLE